GQDTHQFSPPANEFGTGAAIGGNDRNSGGKALYDRQPEALARAGQDRHVKQVVEPVQLFIRQRLAQAEIRHADVGLALESIPAQQGDDIVADVARVLVQVVVQIFNYLGQLGERFDQCRDVLPRLIAG